MMRSIDADDRSLFHCDLSNDRPSPTPIAVRPIALAPVDAQVLQSMTIDRVYDEIYALKNVVNQRFDRLEGETQELNRKFDIVMQHITGQG